MADEDRELPPYPGDASGHLRPGLIDAYTQAAPEHQDYAADAVNKVQDYLTGKAIAVRAEQAGNQFVSDLAATRANLSGMVRSDPFSTDLALSLVPNAIDNLTAHHTNEAERADAAGTIADHLRNEIAIAGIQAHAAISRQAGHAAVDKFGEHLGTGEEDVLRTYTDNLDTLRQADNNASQISQARQMVEGSNRGTMGWFAKLHDPTTGAVMFPPGWGQQMMQDHSLAPDARNGLYQAYTKLQQQGDADASDPVLVSGLLQRMASNAYHSPDHPMPPEIIGHAGDGLTMSDAQFLAGRTGPQTPQTRDETHQLATAYDDARGQIGNPAAFQRFSNWFLGAYRNASSGDLGPADLLNPASKEYMLSPDRMARFQPTGDDIIAPVVAALGGARRSLGEIFGSIGNTLGDIGRAGIGAAQDYYDNNPRGAAAVAHPLGVTSPMAPIAAGAI